MKKLSPEKEIVNFTGLGTLPGFEYWTDIHQASIWIIPRVCTHSFVTVQPCASLNSSSLPPCVRLQLAVSSLPLCVGITASCLWTWASFCGVVWRAEEWNERLATRQVSMTAKWSNLETWRVTILSSQPDHDGASGPSVPALADTMQP